MKNKMTTIFTFIAAIFWFGCSVTNEPAMETIMDSQFQKDSTKNTYSYLALGDSYTIGESVEENKRFPVQLSAKLNAAGISMKPTLIVAQTGWTTDELSAAIQKQNIAQTYNLVTLLIGVNNQYRGRDAEEYRIELQDLLKTSISFAVGNPKNVIVISIPDYGVTPFAKNRNPENIAKEIDLYNQIKKEETQKVGAIFIDITEISRRAKTNKNLIATDGLHPSAEMYKLWVEEIFPKAKIILEN